MIEAIKIADSINNASRLLTIRAVCPKFIHQETLRHRLIYIRDFLQDQFDFSMSVSSSRAIPYNKMLRDVHENPAMPVVWRAEQKGMSGGDELDDIEKSIFWPDIYRSVGLGSPRLTDREEYITKRECAKRLWLLHGSLSATISQLMVDYTGVHKSIANRVIENHVHVHALMTATSTGWMNFFGLRLDKAADDTVRALAEACWKVWNDHDPIKLDPGGWHLPFVDVQDVDESWANGTHITDDELIPLLKKISVARSAHLSYESFETGTRMSHERCVELHDRFLKSVPLHASPFEHQAECDEPVYMESVPFGQHRPIDVHVGWKHPFDGGNLGLGWRQYRKLIPGENLAPLPEAYR